MKKFTIALILVVFVLRVAAQKNTVANTVPMPTPANNYFSPAKFNHIGPDRAERSSTGAAWLNYAFTIDLVYGGTGTFYAFPIFTDSSVYFGYGNNNWAKTSYYSLGQTFNAYSQYFSSIDTISLNSSEGYTLDSIAVPLQYSRLDPDTSIVDTILVNLFQGTYGSTAFPGAFFTASPDTYYVTHFGSDTVYFPEMFYNYQSFGPLESYYTNSNVNAPATTVKILLHQSDTAIANSVHEAIVPNGGLQVTAGNLVGCTVAFKSGYQWHHGDTITLHYNSANIIGLDEENGTGEPTYTPGDNNISYNVISLVQYNESPTLYGGWDSSYIPAMAYLPYNDANKLQDNDIFYHITYTISGTTGISPALINNNRISVYPNPTNGIVNVSSSKIIDELKITNVLGQLIYEAQPKLNLLSFELNSDGMYFVTVTSDNETTTQKVIVAR